MPLDNHVKIALISVTMLLSCAVFSLQLVGHRGASAHAPENTLASVMLAYEEGAFAAECDIQITKDNKLVLMHDDSVLRTSGVDKKVSELTYREIMNLDVGSWKGDKWAGIKVPLLADVVYQIPEDHLLFIEIKGGDNNTGASSATLLALLDLLEKLPQHRTEKLVFISFDHDVLGRFKFFRPDLLSIPLLTHKLYPGSWPQVNNLADLGDYIAMAKREHFLGVFLEYGEYLSSSMIDYIKSQGLMVAVWNYPEHDTVDIAQKMSLYNVDFYNTNDVDHIKTALGL